MGRIVLQMMISLDGMVSGPKGELDWIADDGRLQQDHLERLERADAVIMGSGLYPDMPRYWRNTAADEKAGTANRAIGNAMNKVSIIVYSHKEIPADQQTHTIRVIADDKAFVEDVQRLKRATQGTIVTYGGVRFARSLLQNDLVDEIHLDICPVILGAGQPLFTDLTHQTNLVLRKSEAYDSGATMMHYDLAKA